MKLTEFQLRDFEDGTLSHCNELTVWARCGEHDNCMSAMCHECGNAWCDTIELGVN